MAPCLEQLIEICLQFSTIVFPLILLMLFIYKWFPTKKSPTTLNLPPSPPKLPLLGNIHQLGIYPHRSLHTLSQKYGDLMLIHLGRTPSVVVSSAQGIRELTRTNDVVFANKAISTTIKKLLYNGKDVGTSQHGEYWRQMKSIYVLQLLSARRVRSFGHVRQEETSLLMENIRKSCGSSINLTNLLYNCTKDVICRVAFGKKYNNLSESGTNFHKLLGEFLELVGGFTIGDYIPWLSWVKKINGWDSRVEWVVKEFDEFLERVITEHEDNYNDINGAQNNEELFMDFVHVLLKVQKENTAGFSIGRDNIKALIVDVFSGGMDTTFTVLEWAMTELMRDPTIMNELKKEVREMVNEKQDIISGNDLEKMKYLKAVLKETLRLHPPVSFIGRLPTKDVKLNGYDIPVGTSVLCNIWAIQRDPSNWEEPHKFNPQRFLNSSIDFKGQHFEFTPFGVGRRMCPGITFAFTVEQLILANVMHKFDWSLPCGMKSKDLDMSESHGVVMHKKTPLHVVATPCIP